jgi:hypothetical protein
VQPERTVEPVPYFAVDDRMHDHRKFLKLGADRLAATGLWATAGAWAAGHMTDGFVADYVLAQWDPDGRLAQRLADVGLWETAKVEGDDGFQFHDWAERNGTRESIEAARADAAERQRRSRERRRSTTDGTFGPGDGPGSGGPPPLFEVPPVHVPVEELSAVVGSMNGHTPVTRDSRVTDAGLTPESQETHTAPTQPTTYPTQQTNYNNTSDAPRRTRAPRAPRDYSPEFEAFWAAYHPKRREGKGDAAKAFTKACRGEPLREGESRSTTLTARVARWVAYWQATGMEPRFVPHASTWLNGRRYDDPPPTAPSNLPAVVGGNPDGYRGVTPSGRIPTTTQRVADIMALKELFPDDQ